MSKDSKEPIHSGHFMTSNPHSEIQAEDEDEDVEVDVVDVDVDNSSSVPIGGKNISQDQDEKPVTFYKFGPQKTQSIAIDFSTSKLNKLIKIAYMRLTTPKWKDFKGLKLQWKHRIRLNNIIWRAYYMEFRKPTRKRRAPFCYFSVPDDDTTHTKIEGSLLEGMYWKRRMEAVCAQYKKWRTFNRHAKKRHCCRKRENSCQCDDISRGGVFRNDAGNGSKKGTGLGRSSGSEVPAQRSGGTHNEPQQRSRTPDHDHVSDFFDIDDDFDNEFTNQLFESLNAPFLFPNPKEGEAMLYNNADIMQPGLLSLQPSIDEILSVNRTSMAMTQSEQMDALDFSFQDEFGDPLSMNGGRATANDLENSSVCAVSDTRPVGPGRGPPDKRNGGGARVGVFANKGYSAVKSVPSVVSTNFGSGAIGQSQSLQQQQQQQQNASATVRSLGLPIVITPHVATPLYSQAVYEPQRDLVSPRDQPPRTVPPSAQLQVHRMSAVSQNGSFGGGVPSPLTPPLTLTSSSAAQTYLDYVPQLFTVASSSSSVVISCSPLTGPTPSLAAQQQNTRLANPPGWWFNVGLSQQQHQNHLQQEQLQEQYQLQQQQLQQQQASERSKSFGNRANLAQNLSPSSLSITPNAANGSNSFSAQSLFSNFARPTSAGTSVIYNSLANFLPSSTPKQAPTTVIIPALQQAQPDNLAAKPRKPSAIGLSTESQVFNRRQFASNTNDSSNNDLARYLPQSGPGGVASSSPSLSLASMLSSSSSPIDQHQFARDISLSLANAQFANSINAGSGQFSPASGGPPLSAPIFGTNFSSGRAQSVAAVRCKSPLESQQTPTILQSPPAKKKSLSSPKRVVRQTQPVQQQHQVLGKQSMELHGTCNLFITSSAGPTTTSNRHYANSTADFLSTAAKPSAVTQQQQQTTPGSGLLSPPVPAQSRTARWSSVDAMPASAAVQASGRHSAVAGLLAPSAATDPAPFPSCSSSCPAVSPMLATSPLTPPLQYTEMTNAVVRRKTGAPVPDSLANFLANSDESGQDIPTESTTGVVRKVSGNSSAGPSSRKTSSVLGTSATALQLTVKEESDEKPALNQPFSLGGKRRHNASTSFAFFDGSLSAPADSTLHPEERKRILHLHAEKNRRNALKEGFETLVDAIPLVEQTGVKCTNAVVLNRAAQHIRDLKTKSDDYESRVLGMREKIAKMNEKIALLQSNLPSNSSRMADGGNRPPSTRTQVEQFFERYKKERAREDYRFWLMAEVMKPIVQSYADTIHPEAGERDQLLMTARKWLDGHWNSATLRPIASDTLVRVATASGAFTDEKALSKYIVEEVSKSGT